MRGPRKTCPACSNLLPSLSAKFCGPGARLGFWFWKCKRADKHLHQKCDACGYKWVAFVVEEPKQ